MSKSIGNDPNFIEVDGAVVRTKLEWYYGTGNAIRCDYAAINPKTWNLKFFDTEVNPMRLLDIVADVKKITAKINCEEKP